MESERRHESFRAEGSQLIDQVKRLVHEGNVRRIVIKQEGRTVVELPLTVGVVGVALAPALAAVGAIAALITECTVEVERIDLDRESRPSASTGDSDSAEEPVVGP